MSYRTAAIDVPGGRLHYAVWGERGPLILLSHGITGHHRSFDALARELAADYCLLAPDHRGRGRSRDISGPWGMREHAADVLRVLDAEGRDTIDLFLGHSMGGFIAAVTAAMAPQRVARLLMVDGGLPLLEELPPGMDAEQLIQAVLGPSMERLQMRFDSRQSYQQYWREHPALGPYWDADIEAYLDYDLIGEAPGLRAATRREAVIGDVETQLIGDTVPAALRALQQPIRFLQAPRGLMDGKPLYPESVFQLWQPRLQHFSRSMIDDVNHFTIMLKQSGAAQVAAHLRDFFDA